MNKAILFLALPAISIAMAGTPQKNLPASSSTNIQAQTNPVPTPSQVPTNAVSTAPATPATISVQDMLENPPFPQLRMHALSVVSKKEKLDDSYLKSFERCLEDDAPAIRGIVAQQIGNFFIKEIQNPNPEAIRLLMDLTRDESKDVCFNAVFYGLAKLEKKSDEVVERLLEVAMRQRDNNMLYDTIVESLKPYTSITKATLDATLGSEDPGQALAAFEIYEDMTGESAENADRFLKMPSSRPNVFILKGDTEDAQAHQAQLEAYLEKEGMENPETFISGSDGKYILMLKTFLTSDRLLAEKLFKGESPFELTQQLWLSPELEVQINAMRKK